MIALPQIVIGDYYSNPREHGYAAPVADSTLVDGENNLLSSSG